MIYKIDQNCIFCGAFEVTDVYAPLPHGVSVAPPALSGTEVARWVATTWEVLPSYPEEEVVDPRIAAKAARELAVSQITVTTAAGNTFDGDETSQNRMARAILALQATNTPATLWVLSDNSVIEASAAELAEALALSGAAQSALWVIE